jgi:3'-phosphoadenosine 5'-phosphosulfate sulfotransferase (PAPS reductase)/FAD synthetase
MTDDERLKECVKEFFAFLDYQEESDGGKMFNPITISCCRVMKVDPLNKLLDEMKALSNL